MNCAHTPPTNTNLRYLSVARCACKAVKFVLHYADPNHSSTSRKIVGGAKKRWKVFGE